MWLASSRRTLADAAEGRAQYHAEGLVCIAERISPDVQAGMDRLFGGAIFMVLGSRWRIE